MFLNRVGFEGPGFPLGDPFFQGVQTKPFAQVWEKSGRFGNAL